MASPADWFPLPHMDPTMKRLFAAFTTAAILASAPLSAQTISTADNWTGAINQGWRQSAQTLNFSGNVTLHTFGWWLGQANFHEVLVREWGTGPGPLLYSTTSAFNAGYNELTLNLALNGGTQYAVQFNYLDNTSQTVHYNSVNSYSAGEFWLDASFDPWHPWLNGNDMRFVATYSASTTVPEPSSLALLAMAATLLLVGRRIRRA